MEVSKTNQNHKDPPIRFRMLSLLQKQIADRKVNDRFSVVSHQYSYCLINAVHWRRVARGSQAAFWRLANGMNTRT